MAPTYILVGTTRDLASNGSGGSATFIPLPLPLRAGDCVRSQADQPRVPVSLDPSAAPLLFTGQLHAAQLTPGAWTGAWTAVHTFARLCERALRQPAPRGDWPSAGDLPCPARFGSIQMREPISRHHPGEARAEVADQDLARWARSARDGERGGSRRGAWIELS